MSKSYEKPTISDYGTIAEMTRASGFTDQEDGGNKLLIHHSSPLMP